MKKILLLKGGGGSEHDISLVSAEYIKEKLREIGHEVYEVLVARNAKWNYQESIACTVNHKQQLVDLNSGHIISQIDYCVPCFHGYPGETGEIPSLLELFNIPYLGCGPEASILCFNKVSTKLWFDNNDIPNVPFIMVRDDLTKAHQFFKNHGSDVFVKASNQGSSVGCYHVTDENDLDQKINEALKFSPYVLIEKTIKGRELEISTFNYRGKIHATKPGEIVCPGGFYDFEEKYSQTSKTTTEIEAKNVPEADIIKMQDIAIKAFKILNLKDLSRVDFFYTNSGEIYLNEINSFPGMTPISMFPKMMEGSGVKFSDFLRDRIG